jgi:acyl-CoA thioester hydrolase
MNVMWYVGKFDEATWNLFLRAGITPGYLRANRRGMAAVDQHIAYRRELHAGDVVAVRSQVLEIEGRKIRFRHEMSNEETGEIAAVTTLLGVHMDTVARKACPFPAEIVALARKLCRPAAAG